VDTPCFHTASADFCRIGDVSEGPFAVPGVIQYQSFNKGKAAVRSRVMDLLLWFGRK
jgi:hypothetical protein